MAPDPDIVPSSPAAAEPAPAPVSEAPATPAAAPIEPSGAPSPTDGQPPAAPVGQPPTAGAAPEPFRFRADREFYDIDGATVDPDGTLKVPKAQVEAVKQLLAEGVAHRGSWQQQQATYESRIAELEQSLDQHPDLLRARAYSQQIKALMARPVEEIADWLDNLKVNAPAFEAKAEAELYKAQLETAQSSARAAQDDADARALTPQIESTVQSIVEELAEQHPSVDAGALYGRLMQKYLDRVVYEVPAQQRRMGLKTGEVLLGRSRDGQQLYVVDRGLIEDEFQTWASLTGKSATAATQAVKQNAAALQAAVPPVATGQGGVASPNPVKPLPKTPEEFEKWFAGNEWKGSFPATR